jgi:HK97 family phage major capsid protein
MTLAEKKQELAAKVAKARGFLDAKDMEAYNKIDAEIDTLSAEIKAEEKQLQREAALKEIPQAQSKPAPQDSAKPARIVETPEYKGAFMKAVREGKNSLTAEERAMFKNVMSTAPDAQGGFLVMPAEMEKAIREMLGKTVAMRRLATVITATADRKIPFVTNFGPAAWIEENGEYPESDDEFAVSVIGSNKLGKIIKVSEEFLNDADFDLDGHINRSFARVYSEGEEIGFVSGNGVNKPTGYLVDAETGVTAASSSAITSDELLDLFYSLKSGYRKNAVFMLNDTTEKLLRKLKNTVTGDYLWQPGLQAGQPSTLLGRPVEYSDSMPTVAASAKALAFGDFKEYMIKDTTGMQMQVLDQLYAKKGQVGFKGNERTDGKLLVPEAIKLLVMKA